MSQAGDPVRGIPSERVDNGPMLPLPPLCPSARLLDRLELLTHGVFGDKPAFGDLLTLKVPSETAALTEADGALELADPEGVPPAHVAVESTTPAGAGSRIIGQITPLQHNE